MSSFELPSARGPCRDARAVLKKVAAVPLGRARACRPRAMGQPQEMVQMKTADGHRGVMGDRPVFDWQATCLPVNPLDRQEKRECPTHW